MFQLCEVERGTQIGANPLEQIFEDAIAMLTGAAGCWWQEHPLGQQQQGQLAVDQIVDLQVRQVEPKQAVRILQHFERGAQAAQQLGGSATIKISDLNWSNS